METICKTCDGTGEVRISCCGDEIDDDVMLCPTCFEHLGDEKEPCPDCQ